MEKVGFIIFLVTLWPETINIFSNDMDFTGKIIQVLEPRRGTSSRTGNEWICGQYVIESVDQQFPRKMYFEVFGADKMQQFNLQLGEVVTVSFDVDAREFNGRWFNSIRAFRVDRNQDAAAPVAQPDAAPFGTAPAPSAAPAASAAPTAAPADLTAGAPFASNPGEDLPF